MADLKISELPDATLPIASGVKFEAIQGGVNVKVDADDMPGGSGIVETIVAGTNITVDDTDPANPIISASGGGGGTWGSITGTLSDQTDLNTALGLKQDVLGTFRRLTGDHTLDSTDLASINAGDELIIEMNVASANTVTVPLNATVAFPLGTVINVTQYGAGQTSFIATGGVTINPSAGLGVLTIPSRYTPATLVKVGTNEWYLFNGPVSPTVPTIQDWSASVAPTGFSSVATQVMHYTDDGVKVHVWGVISGTSNTTAFTFSLPLALDSSYPTSGVVKPVAIQNNGVTAVGRMVISGSGNSVTVDSTITGTAWTASGTKALRFEFWYEK